MPIVFSVSISLVIILVAAYSWNGKFCLLITIVGIVLLT